MGGWAVGYCGSRTVPNSRGRNKSDTHGQQDIPAAFFVAVDAVFNFSKKIAKHIDNYIDI